MPHLQFDINKKIDKGVKQKFIKFVEHSFSEIMETGTDHIASKKDTSVVDENV